MTNKTTTLSPLLVVGLDRRVRGDHDISFAEYCEIQVLSGGGKIVRDGLAHGELNGFIFPARTKETLFWEDQLFTPRGLATLFNLKTKTPN